MLGQASEPPIFWMDAGERRSLEPERHEALEKRKKHIDEEMDRLRDMAGKLEESPEEEEAIDLMEKAVEQIENLGKSLEEEG